MLKKLIFSITLGLLISSCGTNPYKESNKVYEQQLKILQQKLAEKEAIALKKVETTTTSHDTLYTKQIKRLLTHNQSPINLLLQPHITIKIIYSTKHKTSRDQSQDYSK